MNVFVFYPCHLHSDFAPMYLLESLLKEVRCLLTGRNDPSQGRVWGATKGIDLFKRGHVQEQRGLLGNKRSGINLEQTEWLY